MTLGLDLVLLGFAATDEQQLQHAQLLTRQLLERFHPKLLEEILYFLLLRTNGGETGERLRDCWPILNALQGRQFRAEALKLYEEWRRRGEIPREIVLRKSMLDEGVGERLADGLAKWAEFLLVRDYHVPGDGDAPDGDKDADGVALVERPECSASLLPSAYAYEMLIPDSPHQQLQVLKSRLAGLQERLTSSCSPVSLSPRPILP